MNPTRVLDSETAAEANMNAGGRASMFACDRTFRWARWLLHAEGDHGAQARRVRVHSKPGCFSTDDECWNERTGSGSWTSMGRGSGSTIRSGVGGPFRHDEISQAGIGKELNWSSTRTCRIAVWVFQVRGLWNTVRKRLGPELANS